MAWFKQHHFSWLNEIIGYCGMYSLKYLKVKEGAHLLKCRSHTIKCNQKNPWSTPICPKRFPSVHFPNPSTKGPSTYYCSRTTLRLNSFTMVNKMKWLVELQLLKTLKALNFGFSEALNLRANSRLDFKTHNIAYLVWMDTVISNKILYKYRLEIGNAIVFWIKFLSTNSIWKINESRTREEDDTEIAILFPFWFSFRIIIDWMCFSSLFFCFSWHNYKGNSNIWIPTMDVEQWTVNNEQWRPLFFFTRLILFSNNCKN